MSTESSCRLGSPRILISRLSHVGDCVLTLPVLNALRDRFPEAYLAWIVEPPTDQLLREHDALNELVVVKRGWLKSPKRVLLLRKELRSLGIETTIDPQSLTKSSVAAWLTGAKRRFGFASGVGRELAPWLNRTLVTPRQSHLVDRSLELLAPLGVTSPRISFRLPRNASAEARIGQYVRDAHLSNGFVVMTPGAGWPSRRWLPLRYGRLARLIGRRFGLPSVIAWAGEKELKWAREIVENSGGQAVMAPRTDLCELAALMRACRLFVGSDSGPLHIAVAVGAPCVGLYGTTKVANSGPYGPGHRTVQVFYQGGTSRQRRRAENTAMRAIDCERAFEACRQQLEGIEQPGNSTAA